MAPPRSKKCPVSFIYPNWLKPGYSRTINEIRESPNGELHPTLAGISKQVVKVCELGRLYHGAGVNGRKKIKIYSLFTGKRQKRIKFIFSAVHTCTIVILGKICEI